MIRLLVADDHAVVRESLVVALRASGECIVVAEAGDGVTAIEKALEVKPDVAIVDISMPRLNGIEVVRRLAHDLPRTRVLVLTMHEEEEYVLHVVRAGASGYVLKHAHTSELLNAVRTLAAGGVHFGPYAAKVLAEQIQQPRHAAEDPYGSLSAREREVLHLIVDGLTTKEISKRLEISVKTAENHRGRVLAKLGMRNSAELVRYAMRKRLVE
ncbi:MAG TPA: response regulator transcription factor [Rudaea sp.]|nr:response regulator transcription factor [Rudaea sp.]